jgi:creatinine amidohydrolase/Fe(II)-dependent formamide hydrolase-like protein
MKYSELNFYSLKNLNIEKKFVLIPIGCMEVHGPVLPFGSDVYIAEAFVSLLEKKIDSIVMPTISYGYSAVTKEIYGTLSIDLEILSNYLKNIIYNLIKLKLKKIIIINIHKDNDLVIKLAINSIFEEFKVPVLYINPFLDFAELDKEIFSKERNSYKETSLILASLRILKQKYKNEKIDIPKNIYKKPIFLKKLLEIGYVKYTYTNEMQHINPEKNPSEKEGIIYMKSVVSEIEKKIHYLEEYINFLKKIDEEQKN